MRPGLPLVQGLRSDTYVHYSVGMTNTQKPAPTVRLAITPKGQTVYIDSVDGDVALVRYPNGRAGVLPLADLTEI